MKLYFWPTVWLDAWDRKTSYIRTPIRFYTARITMFTPYTYEWQKVTPLLGKFLWRSVGESFRDHENNFISSNAENV